MSTSTIAAIMLVTNGVFTGILCGFSIERIWIWDQLPLRDYAVDFRRSVRHVDMVQPVLLVVTIALAAIYASRVSGSSRTEAIVAVVCLVSILAGSVLVLVPMNNEFRDRPEGDVPPEAASIRRRWRIGHLIRTALGVTAFVLLVHTAVNR